MDYRGLGSYEGYPVSGIFSHVFKQSPENTYYLLHFWGIPENCSEPPTCLTAPLHHPLSKRLPLRSGSGLRQKHCSIGRARGRHIKHNIMIYTKLLIYAYVCMYVCVYMYIYIYIYIYVTNISLSLSSSLSLSLSFYISLSLYIYIYIYIYTYTH